MANFKKLHSEWKKAKKNAELVHDTWARMFMTISVGDVQNDAPDFPKFNKNLGPSLVNIEKGKNLEKSKVKAVKAVTLYEKDIERLTKAVKKMKIPEKSAKSKIDPQKTTKALLLYLSKLEDVRQEIAEALDE